MDLGNWLRSLGLERYEAAFRENEIDETVLPELTQDHLREIGILLGARIKILKAIATLKEPDKAFDSAITGTEASVEVAERRQLTVMFCDLVGSTALAASRDPEDLREVISAYQKCAAETVRRFDGFVAKYMGDGVLVYFGYPKAHEDDAERAVRAGLELISALAGLKARTSLQTRIGIATGLVVVGDMIGSGEAQERGIVGETPNLAARLQGMAEPKHGDDCRRHTQAPWQSFRAKGHRPQGTQGHRRVGADLVGVAAEFCREPFRGTSCDPSDNYGRARRGNGAPASALGQG